MPYPENNPQTTFTINPVLKKRARMRRFLTILAIIIVLLLGAYAYFFIINTWVTPPWMQHVIDYLVNYRDNYEKLLKSLTT